MLWVFIYRKGIYNDRTGFMVSWWGRDSYFNNGLIQISDVVIMNQACGASGPFESVFWSKIIGHNTYIGRRVYFR